MAAMTASSPHRYRFTAYEYHQMGEARVLRPEARVELINGELIDMPPISPAHAAAVEQLANLLRRTVADRAMVRTQQPSVISEFSVPQPDSSTSTSPARSGPNERAQPLSEARFMPGILATPDWPWVSRRRRRQATRHLSKGIHRHGSAVHR